MAIEDLVSGNLGQEDLGLEDRCPNCGAKGVEPTEPNRQGELKCPEDSEKCGVLYWFPS